MHALSGNVSAKEFSSPEVKAAVEAGVFVTPWPHDTSDLKVDENLHFGELPNGLRYMIYKNAEPPKRVSLRMHIDAGSLMEDDDQQGLAHFLEHMMFNGSRNFSPEELVPKMQRLGIAFGAHANAYTSFDETVYMLDLPKTDKETLDLGFTVMRDYADGALLKPEEIEKERGVILAEKTSRDSVQRRLTEKEYADLFPSALVPKRFPIGTEEVIKNAPPQRFVDFYREHYIPSKTTFIVVGDIDIDAMEARIKESFASMKNPEKPNTDPPLGSIDGPKGIQFKVYADPEVSETNVSIAATKPSKQEVDSIAKRLADIPLAVANAILDKRFSELAKKEGATIASGSAYHYDLFNFSEIGGLVTYAVGDDWKKALPILEKEYRRVIEHGFTESELSEVRANLLNAYEQALKKKDTRRSESIARSLVNSVNDQSVFTTPETDLEIAKNGLSKLTPEQCHAAFVKFWKDEDIFLSLTSKTETESTTKELQSIWEKSLTETVTPPKEIVTADWAYNSFGEKAEIPKLNHIEDLDIYQGEFSNGLKVNLKKTDFQKGTIIITAKFGKGSASMPKDKPGLSRFASAIYDAGGLGKHSVDDLNRILAGKNISSSFNITEGDFVIAGSTTPDDLLLQLQYMAAQLTDPGFRPEAIRQFRKGLPTLFNELKHSQQGPISKMQARVRNEDPRFIIPEQSVLEAYNADDAKSWLTEDLQNAPIELSVVGDFDQATVIDALAQTFGALSKRTSPSSESPDLTNLEFTKTNQHWNYEFDSKIPKGIALLMWKTTGLEDIKLARRLNVLSQIFDERLREQLREALGAAYSPYAYSSQSDAYSKFGFLAAVSPGQPEVVDKVSGIIKTIAEEIAKKTITDDEVERSLKPTLANLEKSLRDNGYWLNTVLSQSQTQPHRLDWARNRDADYASINKDELNELAAKYLSSENSIRVTILPSGNSDNGAEKAK